MRSLSWPARGGEQFNEVDKSTVTKVHLDAAPPCQLHQSFAVRKHILTT